MWVKSILNNNSVLAESDDGADVIVTGQGIGFKLKRADVIPKSLIGEIYKPQNPKHQALIDMLDNMDPLYLELAEEIIEMAEKAYGQEYSPFLMIELADHIATALDRANKGIQMSNLLVSELKILYKDEYAVGEQARQAIQEKTRVELSEAEAGFIAMHLISSQTKYQEESQEMRLQNLVDDILSLLDKHYNLKLQNDKTGHVRFLTHLKFLAARILQGEEMDTEDISALYSDVKFTERDYRFLDELKNYLKQKYSYTLCDDEEFYLILHLHSLLNEQD